jgi:hypothetical protein
LTTVGQLAGIGGARQPRYALTAETLAIRNRTAQQFRVPAANRPAQRARARNRLRPRRGKIFGRK